MEEIILELKYLKKTMEGTNESIASRIETDPNDNLKTEHLKRKVRFGEVLFAILRNIDKNDLLTISDKDLLKHVSRVQISEKDC